MDQSEQREVTEFAATPAGGQLNSGWKPLPVALDLLALLGPNAPIADTRPQYMVVFRCGTVAQVREDDPEFGGYDVPGYVFPEHRADHEDTVAEVMADNRRVWAAQSAFAGPVGKAVRQAYAKLIAPGYPRPGGPASDLALARTGHQSAGGELFCAFWTHLDADRRVYNLTFAGINEDARSVQVAALEASDHRRCDYMFPEVAALFTPDRVRWAYRREGADGSWRFAPAPGTN